MTTRHPFDAWYVFQRALAAVMLLAALPVLVMMIPAVRLTSRGPFLFFQERPGLHGRIIRIAKVRTMTVGAEASTRLGTGAASPHVTRVGAVLRATKLDELPQLWSIVRGDMAFVGPRPLPISLHRHLVASIPGFSIRESVRPGLTNLGQVCVIENEVGDRLLADWRRRFEAELEYLRHRSVAYDVLLIAMTGLYMLRRLAGLSGRPSHTENTMSMNPHAGDAMPVTEVLGTPIAETDYAGVVAQTGRWIDRRQPAYVCIAPVHSIMEGVTNPGHREALRGANMCTADGVPVVWLQRLMGCRDATRVYGPTLMLHTLAEAERRGWRVAFYGGREDRLRTLVEKMSSQFPELTICEAISPPFRTLTPAEDDALIDRLRAARPDIVLVGLGCPKQERWMADHSPRLDAVMLGVGAAFDFHAGAVRQAPGVLQRLGMEWAFRLAMEPRRLWKRYATTNPPYVAQAAVQVLRRYALGQSFRSTRATESVELGAESLGVAA